MRCFYIFFIGCLVLSLVVGCGEKNPLGRMPVSGTVTFQGRPLESGSIEFAPVDPLGKTKAGGPVVDGKYSIAVNQGLAPGEYVVRVFSPVGAAEAAGDAMPGSRPTAVARERIPPIYNVNSRLRCEVSAEKTNLHDFNL